MSTQKQSPQGTINAAEVAYSEGDLNKTIEALQKALREVREERDAKAGGDD